MPGTHLPTAKALHFLSFCVPNPAPATQDSQKPNRKKTNSCFCSRKEKNEDVRHLGCQSTFWSDASAAQCFVIKEYDTYVRQQGFNTYIVRARQREHSEVSINLAEAKNLPLVKMCRDDSEASFSGFQQ